MKIGWICRWVPMLAVTALVSAVVGQVPAPDVPPAAEAAPADPAKLKWSQVFSLSITDGRLAVKSTLTLAELRGLDGSERDIDGMPGTTTVLIVPRQYEIQNEQRVGDINSTLSISGRRTQLDIELSRSVNGKVSRIALSQTGAAFGRQINRSSEVRLVAEGPDVPDGNVVLDASDFAALRKEHPNAVNRYIRPLLRRTHSNLFDIDLATARQVLFTTEDSSTSATTQPATQAADATGTATTRPLPDSKLQAQIAPLLSELDAAAFPRRQAALENLVRLGPPAVVALTQMDAKRLSAEQNRAIRLLEVTANPVTKEEAARLRSDVQFLADCLYAPDDAIRRAAAERLGQITKVAAGRFADVITPDAAKDEDSLGEIVEKIRDEAAPTPPTK